MLLHVMVLVIRLLGLVLLLLIWYGCMVSAKLTAEPLHKHGQLMLPGRVKPRVA